VKQHADRISAADWQKSLYTAAPHEHEECAALVKWAETQRHKGYKLSELLIHVPNGAYHGSDRKAAAVVARKLREQGLREGVFDYILPIPLYPPGVQGYVPGLWLEMKRTKGGKVSQEQIDFQFRMRTFGWQCEVAMGWVQAAAFITQHLQLAGGHHR
jgi:hypothetical protein